MFLLRKFHLLELFPLVKSSYVTRFLRNFSTSTSGSVRVRFAPSPTGHLHLGGLRTALYNYLYARSHGGTFVLRLEDTDQSRLVPGAAEALERDLAWAGIPPDESPAEDGPYGPYVQSQRLHMYREHVERVVRNRAAYHCFCSERRLELLRREALRARQVPRYDNRCRHLSPGEAQEKLARGQQSCVRFKLEPNPGPFPDLVYGKVSHDTCHVEGDPVIMKSDGYPTYHFASVVDDHLMEISHVLRGVEWQMSTPKHLQIYRALGWEPPQFGHLPLILNEDGSKLSKRQGDIRVAACRERGIFPLALLNYVTMAGGGFDRDLHRAPTRIYPLGELVRTPHKMLDLSRLELQRLLATGQDEGVVQQVQDLVAARFAGSGERLRLEDDFVRSVLRWGQSRVHTLLDFVEPQLAFLWVEPAHAGQPLQPRHAAALEEVRREVSTMADQQLSKERLVAWLRLVADTHNLQFHELMKLLRDVLSGLKEGPGVAEMMAVLGKSETVARLDKALSLSRSSAPTTTSHSNHETLFPFPRQPLCPASNAVSSQQRQSWHQHTTNTHTNTA